jgi:DNA-binding response OmpR family regulator
MTRASTTKNIVVYADDDQDDLELVRDAFALYAQDVDVVSFPDGSSALNYLESLTGIDGSPCLVILDINMPGLNGKDVLVKLRQKEKFEQLPVVLFTTSSQSQDKQFADRYNAGFMTKPLDIRQMEIITEKFIDHCADEVKAKIRRAIS